METHEQQDLLFKNKISPYVGKPLRGRVLETWLRGEKVWALGPGALALWIICEHGHCRHHVIQCPCITRYAYNPRILGSFSDRCSMPHA